MKLNAYLENMLIHSKKRIAVFRLLTYQFLSNKRYAERIANNLYICFGDACCEKSTTILYPLIPGLEA